MEADGTIRYSNKSWDSRLGYEGDESKGLNFFELLTKESEKELNALIKSIEKSKGNGNKSIPLQLKSLCALCA